MLNEKLTSYFSEFFCKIIPKNKYVQWFDVAVEKMVSLRLKTKVIPQNDPAETRARTQWHIQDFSQCAVIILFGQFSRKLHENEKKLDIVWRRVSPALQALLAVDPLTHKLFHASVGVGVKVESVPFCVTERCSD